MKSYKLIDGSDKEFELKGITARVKKELAEFGIKDGNDKNDELLKDILTKPESLEKLCKVLFRGDFKDFNAEDVDTLAVQEGLIDFFLRPILLVYGYKDYMTTLPLPTQVTEK